MSDNSQNVHADLARANVLRLRGDFAEAEQLCVQVLEGSPENAHAHTMLGDIAIAQNKIDQAVEHYEISHQFDSTSIEVTQKLEDARVRKSAQETASSVQQLGLPVKSALPWTTIAFAIFSLICLLVAIGFGVRSQKQVSKPPPGSQTIFATPESIVSANPPKSTPDPAPGDSSSTGNSAPQTAAPSDSDVPTATYSGGSGNPAVPTGGPLEDRAITQLIQAGPQGSHLLSAIQDPRTKLVVLTYTDPAGEDARRVGAALAKAVLDQSGDTQQVTLRAIRDDRLIYVADIPRTRYAETLADSWRTANPAPDAWINHSIVNDWPYRSPDAPDTAAKSP